MFHTEFLLQFIQPLVHSHSCQAYKDTLDSSALHVLFCDSSWLQLFGQSTRLSIFNDNPHAHFQMLICTFPLKKTILKFNPADLSTVHFIEISLLLLQVQAEQLKSQSFPFWQWNELKALSPTLHTKSKDWQRMQTHKDCRIKIDQPCFHSYLGFQVKLLAK